MQTPAALDEPYQYQPLKSDRPAFRLLRLRKGYWTPIECDILHELLDQPTQPYEALSYTWGNPDRNQKINVNGKTLAVTPGLLWTLMHLRYKDQDRILWIDGICIDQNNLVERGQQVQCMGEIYRGAERVIFWLGRATDQTAILMHSIQVFEEESNRYDCTDWTLNDSRWLKIWEKAQSKLQRQLQLSLQVRYQRLLWTQEQGLKTLLTRPWFKRAWIVQEVANARSGQICCGTNTVSAHLFALMPRVLGVPTDQLSQAVLDMMPGPPRLETWWADKRDLYSLLRYLGPRQSSEPRDIVYALRGISTDANTPGTLEPNYEASVEVVIQQISQHLYFCDVNAEQKIVKSIEGLVANVTELNSAAIGQLIKTSRKKELDVILERGGIVISAETIRTASEGGEDWMELLCNVAQGEVSVLTDAIPEIVGRANSTTLKRLRDPYKYFKITPPLIKRAVLNERHGPAMLRVLAQEGSLPPLTRAMWMDSDLNQVSGSQVREAMLEIWNIRLPHDSFSMSQVAKLLPSESHYPVHPRVSTPRQTHKVTLRGRIYSLVEGALSFMLIPFIPGTFVLAACKGIYSVIRSCVKIIILPHFELSITHISCAVINHIGLGRLWGLLRKDHGTGVKGNFAGLWFHKMRWFPQHKAISVRLMCARLRDTVTKVYVSCYTLPVDVINYIVVYAFMSVSVIWFVFAYILLC